MRTKIIALLLVLAQTALAQKPPPIDMESCKSGYTHTATACDACGKYAGAVLACFNASDPNLRFVEIRVPQTFVDINRVKVKGRIRTISGKKGSRFALQLINRNQDKDYARFGFNYQTADGTKPTEDYFISYRIKGR